MNTDDFFNNFMYELGVSERKKQEERKAKQQTYLMKDENTGYVKIGVSINPQLRERTLQSQKPTISLFATIKRENCTMNIPIKRFAANGIISQKMTLNLS